MPSRPPVLRRLRSLAAAAVTLSTIVLTSSFAVASTACGDVTGTGDNCTKGCKCGRACIDCSKSCTKSASYARTSIVPDSLKPR